MTTREPVEQPEATWAVALQRATDEVRRARSRLNAVAGDAARAGVTPRQLRRQRQISRGVGPVLGRIRAAEDEGHGAVDRPPLPRPPVVLLESVTEDPPTEEDRAAITRAMWQRGWYTTSNQTEAHNLDRGAAVVIRVRLTSSTATVSLVAQPTGHAEPTNYRPDDAAQSASQHSCDIHQGDAVARHVHLILLRR